MNKNLKKPIGITCYDNYPAWIVTSANILEFTTYLIGTWVVYQTGLMSSLFYIAIILVIQFRLLQKSCVNCYYYGKICFSGRGKLVPYLFNSGKTVLFTKAQFSFFDILPDLLILLIPLTTGVILLYIKFNLMLAIMLVVLLILATSGNSFIRGLLACKFCKQRLLGCPAEQSFNKSRE